MTTDTSAAPVSRKMLWTGYVLSALPVLMIAFSAVMKLQKPRSVVEGFAHLGWTMSQANGLAILQLACAAVYLLPRTAVLGAILLTGYLGGATAACVRVGDNFYPPVILGVLAWGGLFLRDPRVRALLPFRR